MKNFKHFLLAVLLAMMSIVSSFAYDFEVDGIFYNILSEEELTCEVTYKDQNYKSYSGNLDIPSSVTFNGRNYLVTIIGDFAFSYCTDLISVKIPNSVTTIGASMLRFCRSITSVTIGTSVVSIGKAAFKGCSALKEITSLNTTPPDIDKNSNLEGFSTTSCILKVPSEAVEAYKSAEYWKEFWNIVGIDVDAGIFCMEAKKAVVIAPTADGLRISGTERGEMISVYALDGNQIAAVVAEGDVTEIACPQGIAVVKIGDKAVKVNVK